MHLWHLLSVTEEEITSGILHSDNPSTECFWFKRNMDNLENSAKDKLAKRFMDITADGTIDSEAFKLLENVR